MTDTTEALVARLKGPARHRWDGDEELAADTISRLTARIAELEEACNGSEAMALGEATDKVAAEARADRAKAKLAEAVKVIEPFARVAEADIDPLDTDQERFRQMSDRNARAPLLTVGDMRACVTFLASLAKETAHG